MTNRPKQQGTAFETALTSLLSAVPGVTARRLAEAGTADRGDVEALSVDHMPIVLEAKCAERISPHTILAKAIAKNSGSHRTALVWKRLQRTHPDNQRRTQPTVGPVVIMPLALFAELLEHQETTT